jgi:Tfp pilus assembly protein PilF
MVFLLLLFLFTISVAASAQNGAGSQPPPSVTILDSTKEQDGLLGSVRRVKTETARLELKSGLVVEGSRQLVELTTYALNGSRIENVSYPVSNSSIGKEEYKYDDKGHIIEMTLRGDGGMILSREAYDYEFDRFGNWTKMITSLVVFEDGKLKREPVEVTYRSFTYYFDDSIATAVAPTNRKKVPAIPASTGSSVASSAKIENGPNQLRESEPSRTVAVPDRQPPEARNLAREDKPPSTGSTPSFGSTTAETNKVEPDRSLKRTETTLANKPVDQPAGNSNRVTEEKPASPAPSPPARNSSAASTVKSTVPAAPKSTPVESESAISLALTQYKKGAELFEVGDVNGAVTSYLKAIDLEPKSAEFRLALGHAYLKLQKDKDAAKALKESVRLNPEVAEAQYGLGLAYFRLERHKDAADAFKKATQINPEMAKAHYGLALAYQELGKQDAVVDQYRILEKLDRNLARQLALAFPDFNLPCRVPPFCK